ncbi:hypothetical protein G6011_01040 [Alternaria panax]|uniref:Uncharacterized protein n=1 Tax=Alternaria panax TaxID=48097 RepID=A0AAD4IKD3_9PLEO|nr:hypothetical protein G6011_01040 [Alternaria panax]
MTSNSLPIGLDESHRQLFATSLRVRLELELQRQVAIYAGQFSEVSEYQVRCIFAEHVDAFLQSIQDIPRSLSPSPPHAAQNMASKAEIGTSHCRRYLLLLVQSLPNTTTFIFQGNLHKTLRSTPDAIIQQALSSPDLIELLRRQHGTPSTCLPVQGVMACPIVEEVRKIGHAVRVGGAFKNMIRVAMKTFSHLFKDTSFGKLLEQPVARFILGLILERECANFGPTPVFVDRAHIYALRLRDIICGLNSICCSAEEIKQIMNKLRIPTVFDMNHPSAIIRQSMSVGGYISPLANSVAFPRTVTALAFIPQIAQTKLAIPKNTSTAFGSKTYTVLEPCMSVPVASSMNVLQHTTPVQPAQTVPKVHAMSPHAKPIMSQSTQLIDVTAHTVNTNGSSAIFGAIPQSDAMEGCISELIYPQQVVTADSHPSHHEAMDGVETSYAPNHGTNDGRDEMDDIQITSQAAAASIATYPAQTQNQNMPGASPPAKATFVSTVRPNATPFGSILVEIKDQDMPDVSPPAHSTISLTIQPNFAPPAIILVENKDKGMTEAPPPAQARLISSRSASEARNVTAKSSIARPQRPTSGYPLVSTTYRSPFDQPSEASSFSDPNGTESTIQSRAKSLAQANTHDHWSDGKAHTLFTQFPQLHQDLQQACPAMIKEPQRNRFKQQVLDYINDATSAAELRDNIDHAMKNQLLTNAKFNKLRRYAFDGQHARRREAQEIVGILNIGNPPQTNNQIGLSQAYNDGPAQPAISVMLFGSSQVAPKIIAPPTTLATPPQTANASAAVSSGPLTRRESKTPEPQSSKEKLTRLLIEAQRKAMNRKDEVWTLFASMLDFSWQKPSDNDAVIDYVNKHPRFQGSDNDKRKKMNIEWTIDVIQKFVDDKDRSSCELLIWTCNEALNARDVKAEKEIPGACATCADRQKELGPLFRRILATNFELVREVYPNGCLTWDEMKDLAKAEELGYFNKSVNKKLGPYVPYMRELKEYWCHRANMNKFIVDRTADQNMATGQSIAFGLAGSSKPKHNIAGVSFDQDKVSKENGVGAMGDTNVPRANESAPKRFREAPTKQEERATMKEKYGRHADGASGSDRMKRSRE